MSSVITVGAMLPGTRTAPIRRSAVFTVSLSVSGVDFMMVMFSKCLNFSFSCSILLSFSSRRVTFEPRPPDVSAAFAPAQPPPTITTCVRGAPVIFPRVSPLPLYFFWRYCAPYWVARTPAVSLMGVRSGRRLFSSVTVS